jgi:hypothetical protein
VEETNRNDGIYEVRKRKSVNIRDAKAEGLKIAR